jgi:aminoglycoside phosphotransferase (APT) family kinase protein
MSHAPWASDHDLDAAAVRALLQAQFSDLDIRIVEPLGEGWDQQAFVVDDKWVFRFPKRRDAEQRISREDEVLKRLAPKSPIPLPSYRFHGKPSESYPLTFVGYRKLPGTPLQELESGVPDLGAIATEIAAFLSWLHSFEDVRFSQDLHTTEEDTLAAFREEALEDLQALREVLQEPLYEALTTHLGHPSTIPEEHNGPPKLIHNDLGAEHILLDQASGKITGIIDWGDVALGDPAFDFAGLWVFAGEDFLQQVLRSYSSPIDQNFLERVRFVALCWALCDMKYGFKTNISLYFDTGLTALERIVANLEVRREKP